MDRVIDLLKWSQGFDIHAKPWLLLGKGPSYSMLPQVDLDEYFVCTLNHVIAQTPATVAHVIDIDVVVDCAQAIERQAQVLMMPYHPHEQHKPSAKSIVDYFDSVPVLRRMAEAGRLVAYNLSTSARVHRESPVVAVKFFSAEAALNMLATVGVRKVRSLGVDGGNTYASKFGNLSETTLLANGHESFDNQFRGIAETLLRTGIDYAPWYMSAPVKVFVGSDQAQIAGVKVLEYSIKKHASLSVEVQVIDDQSVPIPKDPKNRSRTGFSFSRFRIPELCGYRGKGIYVDADMLVFQDIAKLWNQDFEGRHLLYSEQSSGAGRIPQFSVMLLDCEALDWRVQDIVAGLDEGRYDYAGLMQKMCIVSPDRLAAALPSAWNSLEHYEPGVTCLLHYTDMPTQPWVSHANKHGGLWYEYARQAHKAGFLTDDFLYEEVARGNVSPDLPGWLGLPKPKGHSDMIVNWVPPFRRFAALPPLNKSAPPGVGPAIGDSVAVAARNAAKNSPDLLRRVLRKARGLVRGY